MIYYRVSDKSYEKVRLAGSSKWVCFCNFLEAFPGHKIEIIADNCLPETVELFGKQGFKLHETRLSNAGSLRFAFDLAADLPAAETVYFVEDDYLHLPRLGGVVEEGLGIADYVTLYDHPDKYSSAYDFGEVSKVVKTESTHWRYTISTCMSFATTAKMIKEDRVLWEKHIHGVHPHDHAVFSDLKNSRKRRLAVCIPGKANHCDLAHAQEPWAVQMMVDRHLQLSSDHDLHDYRDQILAMKRSPGDTLKMLRGLLDRAGVVE